MAILLTGGTGKTSTSLAQMLGNADIPFILASRSAAGKVPSDVPSVKFDWLDSATFENPFKHEFKKGERIEAAYLVSPESPDAIAAMSSLIEHIVEKQGVKRIVMLTGSSTEMGDSYHGQAWQLLDDLKVDYTVLRATWFMENFAGWPYVSTIKDEGKISTACGDGKVPFISAKDIAATAFSALTSADPLAKEMRVLGPELLTHDQVADKLSRALGRQIVHVKLSEEEAVQKNKQNGLPDQFATFMAHIEIKTSWGAEDMMNDAVEKTTGRSPQNFDDWVQEHKAAWQ